MNEAIRIRTEKGTLLVCVLSSYCLDHDDVTLYNSKGESSGKQKGGEKKMRRGSFREK
jgi:hypothetical protein